MAKIRALSSVMPHDSVRNRKRASSVSNGLPVRKRRRIDLELHERCQQAWNNLEDVRQTRERIKRYVYGDQWGDVIEKPHRQCPFRRFDRVKYRFAP